MIRYHPSELIRKLEKLPDDKYVTFNFLQSWFENELDKETRISYENGFTKGAQTFLEKKVSEVTMSGIRYDIEEIYKKILECKKKIFYSGYTLMDAPYHGWYGEPLKEVKNCIDVIENNLNFLISVLQTCLGLEINPNAWDENLKD